MNRSQAVRAIFFELRRVLGTQLSSGDLLRVASEIIVTYQATTTPDQPSDLDNRRSLYVSPVDRAMSDGGWQVMYFEENGGMALVEDCYDAAAMPPTWARVVLGRTEWPWIATAMP